MMTSIIRIRQKPVTQSFTRSERYTCDIKAILWAISANGQSLRSTRIVQARGRERRRRGDRTGESSASFLPSFLPSALDRRRFTLTADAYEADVKTFVKYEGTARGRSIRRHPRG